MSQEWLKQLAELSNDKELRKRAQQLEKKAQRGPAARPAAGGPRRSLLGAAVGHFFRWLFLFALAEAAAMFVVASNEGLENEPWGVIYHYLVWYPLTQPIFPAEIYQGLQDWFGLTASDLAAFYDRINPVLQEQQDALVFYTPVAASLAFTLFFLPAINAARRRSPIRGLVWIANWAVVFLAVPWGEGVIALWLAAFVFSFLGGIRRAPRQPKPQPQPQPQAHPQPRTATAQARPARRPQKAAQPTSAATAAAAAASAIDRTARASFALNKREPTVLRRGGGASWVRAR
jgi:hypothetical protein